jgi:hypothetical protein
MSMRPLRRSVWSDVVGRATKIQAFAFAGLICVLCQCTRHYNQKEAERYIVESKRQWAESVASGDTEPVERILADDFLGVDPQGRL